MSYESLPPSFDTAAEPYEIAVSAINRTSLAMSGYVFFVLYPAYAVLRSFWIEDADGFSLQSVGIALLTAVGFGLYARRTISRLVRVAHRPDL